MTNFQDDKEYSIQLEANPTIAFLAGRILDIKTGKDITPVQRTDNGVVKWDKKNIETKYPQVICTNKIIDNEKKMWL